MMTITTGASTLMFCKWCELQLCRQLRKMDTDELLLQQEKQKTPRREILQREEKLGESNAVDKLSTFQDKLFPYFRLTWRQNKLQSPTSTTERKMKFNETRTCFCFSTDIINERANKPSNKMFKGRE